MKTTSSMMVTCAVALSLAGCLEIETTTRVNSDGTLRRTVEITGDSATLAGGGYPVTLRGEWERELTPGDRRKFRLRAARTFRDVEELNAAIRGEPARSIELTASLDRTFLWFTTTYRYAETFGRFYPFDVVPVTDFVSGREIDLYLRHEMEEAPSPTPGDSLALDDASERFNAWEARNRFEAFYRELAAGVARAEDPALSAERLARMKERLFERGFRDADPVRIDSLIVLAGNLLGDRGVRRAFEANREGFAAYDRKLEFLETVVATGFNTSVEMPGLITDTNAPSIEGNTVSWSDFKAYTYVRDYTMWVESRQINWWAVTVTALAVLALMGVLVFAGLRRRPRPA